MWLLLPDHLQPHISASATKYSLDILAASDVAIGEISSFPIAAEQIETESGKSTSQMGFCPAAFHSPR
jgi:hypothetical protein